MKRKSYYMLRRCLVFRNAEQIIKEIEEYCMKNFVDEVLWTFEGEEFNQGLPTLASIEAHISWIKKTRKILEEIGVKNSLYSWATLNHADRGRSFSKNFPGIQCMVDYTGTLAKAGACPLSPAWRDYIVSAFSLYASAEPHSFWIDDDIRLFNHSHVDFGCFCPIHLKGFSDIMGREISREELVDNILSPGKPHPHRKLWFDFLSDTMVEVAQLFERTIHSTSPNTTIGLMLSNPHDHSLEGRNWHKLLKALSGNHSPLVRPSLGNYQEGSFDGIYYTGENLRRTMYCLPVGTQVCPEIENLTYTRFSKSAKFTKTQIALCMAMKTPYVTLGLYDHMGTPLDYEPAYGKMLKTSKPYFDALTSKYLPNGKERGIGLIHHEKAGDYVHTGNGLNFKELLSNDDGWAKAIQACGVPVTFESSDVFAVTGQILRAFGRDEVIKMLSCGILMDASCAQTLLDEGYGEYLGVRIKKWLSNWDIPLTAEKVIDTEFVKFSDYPEALMTLTHITESQMMAELSPSGGAKAITLFITPDGREVMPGMIVFENRLGGRVCIYPFDLQNDTGKPFLNWQRKYLLVNVLRWLGKGKLPLFVEGGAQMLPLRTDYPDYTLVSILNLSTDEWEYIDVTLFQRERPFGDVEMLDENGEWVKTPLTNKITDNNHLKMRLSTTLGALEMKTFLIHLKT